MTVRGKIDRTIIDSGAAKHAFDDEPKTNVDQVRLIPGLRIEHYELIRELGRGGMGQVFLARDNRLGRRVAMKFLSSTGRMNTERFLVEARATALCQHENIVTIYDVNEYLGVPYMALEYVEGATLAKLMEKRLPVGRTVELILPVLRALAAAHDAHIIHRDLKPENIVVTVGGTVKVLDFGVASQLDERSTAKSSLAGTLPYMSPEQLAAGDLDPRSDLWAVGILMYEMLAGKHPLEPVTQGRLLLAAGELDQPMPSLATDMPGLPDRIVDVVGKCLAKRKEARYGSAAEIIADLEPLLPGRSGRSLAGDESPYPGLTAFQESDADRFFGRSPDIAAVIARLRDQPLVAVVGPSGVGKSSFLRAGVVPALKVTGEPWEVMIVRPGRYPLSALASTLESLRDSRDSDPIVEGEDLTFRLRSEPGTFGARLRARAKRKRSQILLFVDQHEELYTLVSDPRERAAFTACLAGAGDDAAGPVRVVVAMRSDFLDRAAEDRRFVDELTRGLVFLQPPSRAGLEEALTQPLAMAGFSFEPGVVSEMLDALEATSGSLPLLQFTAAKLWDTRDRTRRVLTREAYIAMGGVAGALASHADEVLAGLSAPDQKLARSVLMRLVTPERTRAIVDTSELRDIAVDVDRIVAHLVSARLLVIHTRGEAMGSVELVHESLIKSWPTLTRWLDENQEDAAYLGQIRAAAKQWDSKGRPEGLLWRAEAMEELRLWHMRYLGVLPDREAAFVHAVLDLGSRAARRRGRLIAAAFAILITLVATAGVALLKINALREEANAQKRDAVAARDRIIDEQRQKDAAVAAKLDAEREAAAKAEAAALAEKEAAEKARKAAEAEKLAAKATQESAMQREVAAKAQTKAAKAQTQAAKAKTEAAKAAAAAKAAEAKAKPADERRKQITTTLKR